MTLESLALFVVLATAVNIVCIVLLGVATFYTVRNYRVLRRIQARTVPPDEARVSEAAQRIEAPPRAAAAPRRETIPRPEPAQRAAAAPTQRYDSLNEPDRGQIEWTGPVTPYIPADRVNAGSEPAKASDDRR
jgi:hypothetical protein